MLLNAGSWTASGSMEYLSRVYERPNELMCKTEAPNSEMSLPPETKDKERSRKAKYCRHGIEGS
jgi:hypothetical protein